MDPTELTDLRKHLCTAVNVNKRLKLIKLFHPQHGRRVLTTYLKKIKIMFLLKTESTLAVNAMLNVFLLQTTLDYRERGNYLII